MRRAHKYGAKAAEVDGIRFASQKEARRYQELRLLEKAGEITGLILQPTYDLMVISRDLRTNKVGEYRADFTYYDKPKQAVVVEDVKGYDVPLQRWKRRHAEAQYGIDVVLIR